MKILIFVFVCLIANGSLSQNRSNPNMKDALEEYGFIKENVIIENDTVVYFIRNYTEKPKNLVVFIQGTDANPIFSFSKNQRTIKYYRWFPDDYKNLDSTYTYAIIPKPGMSKLYDDQKISIPKTYYDKNFPGNRVHQLNISINHIIKNHLNYPNKIIVYGHSEGAAIAATLATVNNKITHLGFWSGNVLNNFYEFSLFNRLESLKGDISDDQAHQNIMNILNWYKAVKDRPNNTDLDDYGFTNKRWYSYEKAPIDYLLDVQIPIYALFATEDESTPIETAYFLPVKFIEKNKSNLTFKVCIGCDHSYQKKNENKTISTWGSQFVKFINWINKSN